VTFLLGLRLAVAGGRAFLLRLAVTAIGVAMGVLFLLLSLTGQSAVLGRAERSGWQSAHSETRATAPDAAMFLSVTDYHNSRAMTRAYVAALGTHPPVPPGLERLPEPGEVAVSPAMRRLLESTPDDQLDDRYPGRVDATIGDAGLAHADELVAIIGRTPNQLDGVQSESLQVVRGFNSVSDGYVLYTGLSVFLLIGAALVFVPVVVFIVMSTRIAAAQREQRLAAIRLVGATRLQASAVAAVETGVAAVTGCVLGWAGYEVGRRILAATLTLEGAHFFAEDVVVAPWVLLLILFGVPVLAVLTTLATISRVWDRPLGASRQSRRRPPSAWRALPLAIGVGGQLAAAPLRGVVDGDTLDKLAPLFVLTTVVGFVTIGPWLCMFVARGFARVSRRVPGLIAARRMEGDPRATFRAVSGVVLAAFVVTYSASLIDTSNNEPYDGGAGVLRAGVVKVYAGGVSEARVAPLLSERAVVTRFDVSRGEVVESCQELARVLILSCSPRRLPDIIGVSDSAADTNLAIMSVYVPTDGTAAAENRVRTQAANLLPNAIIHTQDDRVDVDARFFGNLGQQLRVIWYFVLIVAACSLTVGMVAGIIERRRPFALLRASGLRLGELRQVVFLETAGAMLVTAAAGIGLGLASSYATARFGDTDWMGPDAGVFAFIGIGVLAALILSTLALPLLDASTRHDAVRYE
jgi:hypothetical protein